MALLHPQQAQSGDVAVPADNTETGVTYDELQRASLEEPGPRYDYPPLPSPLSPAPMRPPRLTPGNVWQVAPAAEVPGWPPKVLAVCGIVALVVGGLAGYLMVQLALAG